MSSRTRNYWPKKKTRTKLTINTISFNENGCGRLDSLICEVHGRLGRGHRFHAQRVYYAPPRIRSKCFAAIFFLSSFFWFVSLSLSLSLSRRIKIRFVEPKNATHNDTRHNASRRWKKMKCERHRRRALRICCAATENVRPRFYDFNFPTNQPTPTFSNSNKNRNKIYDWLAPTPYLTVDFGKIRRKSLGSRASTYSVHNSNSNDRMIQLLNLFWTITHGDTAALAFVKYWLSSA